MAVPAAKVKEVCTDQEAATVRASRKPVLDQLTPAELKQHAARARKLYDKWLALSRSQARDTSKKVGFGESKANTALKLQIFEEALKSLDDKLAKQGPVAGSTKKAVTKKKRSAGHRAARADVRAELSEVKESLKEPARKAAKKKSVKKVAAKKAATKKEAEPVAAELPVKKRAVKKKATKKKAPKTAPIANPGLNFDKKKARQAETAAKQSRLDRSGVTTRMRGHVSARGKRAQGRRDSKG